MANLYGNGPSTVTWPTTYAEIKAELDNIEYLVKSVLDDPKYFATMIGGTVNLSMKDYIEALEMRRNVLLQRLNSIPYWVGTEIDTVI